MYPLLYILLHTAIMMYSKVIKGKIRFDLSAFQRKEQNYANNQQKVQRQRFPYTFQRRGQAHRALQRSL